MVSQKNDLPSHPADLLVQAVIEPRQNACTAERRLAGVRQIPFAYNQRDLGASNAAFDKVPFGTSGPFYLCPGSEALSHS